MEDLGILLMEERERGEEVEWDLGIWGGRKREEKKQQQQQQQEEEGRSKDFGEEGGARKEKAAVGFKNGEGMEWESGGGGGEWGLPHLGKPKP